MYLFRKPERQRSLVRLWYVREHVTKTDKGTDNEDMSGN
jgi:hypothetical protein